MKWMRENENELRSEDDKLRVQICAEVICIKNFNCVKNSSVIMEVIILIKY